MDRFQDSSAESKEIMGKLYECMGNDPQVAEDDRDYGTLLLSILDSLISGARFILQEKELGKQMLEKKRRFMEGSSLLADLPIRVVTGQVTQENAKKFLENTNRALDEWVRDAQNFFQTRPTASETLGKGFKMIKGDEVNVGNDLDYTETVKDLKGE